MKLSSLALARKRNNTVDLGNNHTTKKTANRIARLRSTAGSRTYYSIETDALILQFFIFLIDFFIA